MKKILFTVLVLISVLLMGCSSDAGGESPVSGSNEIGYEDKNGETITVTENGTTISNIKNASLVVSSSVTDLKISNAILTKITVNSNAELFFVNTRIEELEGNGTLAIKKGAINSGNRSARTANAEAQAQKENVVIDKLVMKGNVEAEVGLYKSIERAAEASDKEFVLSENSSVTIKDYNDGEVNQFTLTPAYESHENFYGVKINQTYAPNKTSPLYLSVFLKKGETENQIFWGDTRENGSSDNIKAIVNSNYFYWPFLKAGDEYQITMCYYTPREGTNGVLTACKTITVNPTKGKGDIEAFLDEKKGTVEFKENGDIVWTKKPSIAEIANSSIGYELLGRKADGTGKWLTFHAYDGSDSTRFDTHNIYKNNFFSALTSNWNNEVVGKKVFLIINFHLETYDEVNGNQYKYSVHTPLIKGESNDIVYDESKYEPAS